MTPQKAIPSTDPGCPVPPLSFLPIKSVAAQIFGLDLVEGGRAGRGEEEEEPGKEEEKKGEKEGGVEFC